MNTDGESVMQPLPNALALLVEHLSTTACLPHVKPRLVEGVNLMELVILALEVVNVKRDGQGRIVVSMKDRCNGHKSSHQPLFLDPLPHLPQVQHGRDAEVLTG